MFELLPEHYNHPITSTSYDGYSFDPTSMVWKISREYKINLKWVDELLDMSLAQSFMKVLSFVAQKYSAAHTNNQCCRFQMFAKERWNVRHKQMLIVSSEDLIGYRSTLNRESEYHLGSLRSFFKIWTDLGYTGVEESVGSLLDNWRLRGNVKGRAVQTLCPIEGPLSDLEFEALHQALGDALETNTLPLEDFVLAQIFIATGRRPAQLADLKVKDFIDVQAQSGLKGYLLNVPRRKQRGVTWREQFKAFAIAEDLGMLVRRLIQENKDRLCKISNGSSAFNFEELPLFPKWKAIDTDTRSKSFDNIDRYLQSPEVHHITAELRKRLDNIVSSLEIPSERTGKKLRVFPTRLRRTLATRAAREGFGELVIAELLDHTDTQNAKVYTENVPEHVDAINKAIAIQLAPLAQAFSGVLINKETDAIRGDDMSSRVRCDNGNVGTCGHYGFCGALAPIACYTCRNFQPWIDGPHKTVLDSLIADRERVMKITKDKTMASINDRTILAVTQVIQNCEARKAEMQGGLCLG